LVCSLDFIHALIIFNLWFILVWVNLMLDTTNFLFWDNRLFQILSFLAIPKSCLMAVFDLLIMKDFDFLKI